MIRTLSGREVNIFAKLTQLCSSKAKNKTYTFFQLVVLCRTLFTGQLVAMLERN